MLFKNRHQAKNFSVGFFITGSDLEDASDVLHEQNNASIAQTKREAAQKREINRIKREKRQNRVMFATPFNRDELAEEDDLMTYLNKL